MPTKGAAAPPLKTAEGPVPLLVTVRALPATFAVSAPVPVHVELPVTPTLPVILVLPETFKALVEVPLLMVTALAPPTPVMDVLPLIVVAPVMLAPVPVAEATTVNAVPAPTPFTVVLPFAVVVPFRTVVPVMVVVPKPVVSTARVAGLPFLPINILLVFALVIATSPCTELVRKPPAVPTTPKRAVLLPLASCMELLAVTSALLKLARASWLPVAEAVTLRTCVAAVEAPKIASAVPVPLLLMLFCVVRFAPVTEMPVEPPAVFTVRAGTEAAPLPVIVLLPAMTAPGLKVSNAFTVNPATVVFMPLMVVLARMTAKLAVGFSASVDAALR